MKRSSFIALNIIIALIIVIVISLVLFLTWDEDPPNDGDLRLARLNIPDDENAFTWYEKAREKLAYTDDEQDKLNVILEPEDQAPGPDVWTLAADVVDRNAEVFDLIARGNACEQIQAPEVTRFTDELPYLGKWRTMARLMSIRAELLSREGKHREALEQAMAGVRFGHKTGQCQGPVICWLVGVACKKIGYRRVHQLIAKTPLDDTDLQKADSLLAPLETTADDLINSFRVEYVVNVNTVDDVMAGRYGPIGGKKRLPILLPNQTKRLFADHARTMIRNVSRNPAQYERSEAGRMLDEFSKRNPIAYRNIGGKMLIGMVLPAMGGVAKESLDERVWNRLTRLLIAIRRYHLATGGLPESLDKLVPQYIDAVPVDLFDGKPIRYDPAKKIIYSIGTDCEDNGGDEEKDTVVKIEF